MTPDEDTPIKDAAEWAADPSRLMDGEDPQTRRLSDAIHWIKVYDELITFKDEMIDLARSRMADLPESAAEEIGRSDVLILTAERSRFTARLDFWKGHHRTLEADETTSF